MGKTKGCSPVIIDICKYIIEAWHMAKQKDKIAIINLARMGDLLLTGPMIDRIKEKYPDSEIHLIAVTRYMFIAEGMDVDFIIPFDFNHLTSIALRAASKRRDDSFRDLLREFKEILKPIRDIEYKAIINVSHTDHSAVLAFLLNGPVVSGLCLDTEGFRIVRSEWAQYFFAGNLNRGLNPFHLADVMYGSANEHVEDVGRKSDHPSTRKMRFNLPVESVNLVSDHAQKLGIEEKDGYRVVIQCGASEDNKRWEPDKFGQVGKLLSEREKVHFILVGTEEERIFAEEAAVVIGNNAYVIAGDTDLFSLASWLDSADLLITNDTGTMHLAQAVGTRSIVITLGSALSDETGPYGSGNIVIEPEIDCFPCSFQVDCPHFNCHKIIDPELVARVAASMLTNEVNAESLSREINGGCIVWETGFDEDGWWIKEPLIPPRLDQKRIIREFFREFWKSKFEPSSRPDGPDAGLILRNIEGFKSSRIADLLNDLISKHEQGLRDFITDASKGEKLAQDLGLLCENDQDNFEEIAGVGDQIFAIDQNIDKTGLVNESWRPILMMFHFGKENLSPGSLSLQAQDTRLVYKDLKENAVLAANLLNRLKRVVSKGESSIQEKTAINILKKHLIGENGLPKNGMSGRDHRQRETVSLKKSPTQRISSKRPPPEFGNLRALSRPRMKGRQYSILMPMSNYYVQKELAKSFRNLGHRVTELQFESNPNFIEQLLNSSINADLLVTINHLGFDQHGELANLLSGIELPYVSWYVDRPEFILLDFPVKPCDMSFIFTWEKKTIEKIKEYGFESVTYLPLATDPDVFKRGVDKGIGQFRWIANSMVYPSRKWQKKAEVFPPDKNNELKNLFSNSINNLLDGREEPVNVINQAAESLNFNLSSWSKHRLLTFASAVALTATQELRRDLAKSFIPHNLNLYGDDGWKELAPQLPYRGWIDYPNGLPFLYRGGIHLNVTNYQMPTGVNQRVFDIPLCGGTLLTDQQEDMFDFFDPDEDCFLFENSAEALDITAYILKNSKKAEKKMKNAGEKILAEHTYNHRARLILSKVKEKLGTVSIATNGG